MHRVFLHRLVLDMKPNGLIDTRPIPESGCKKIGCMQQSHARYARCYWCINRCMHARLCSMKDGSITE
jgi:hypothetical protein